MNKYGIDENHVVRHYDITHKQCPAPLVDNMAWQDFKKLIMKTKEDEPMTEAEKAKMQAIDDTVTRLHAKVSDIDASLTNLYSAVNNLIDRTDKRYNTIDEVPEWAKSAVIKSGLQGDGTGLNLSEDIIRTLVILERKGVI